MFDSLTQTQIKTEADLNLKENKSNVSGKSGYQFRKTFLKRETKKADVQRK